MSSGWPHLALQARGDSFDLSRLFSSTAAPRARLRALHLFPRLPVIRGSCVRAPRARGERPRDCLKGARNGGSSGLMGPRGTRRHRRADFLALLPLVSSSLSRTIHQSRSDIAARESTASSIR